MQKDLALAIITAIVGAVAASLVCGLLVGEINSTTVKTVDSNIGTELADPDPEVFNYKALNPTVEVYIGSCSEYDATTGECIDQITAEEFEELIEDQGIYDTNEPTTNGSQRSANGSSN